MKLVVLQYEYPSTKTLYLQHSGTHKQRRGQQLQFLLFRHIHVHPANCEKFHFWPSHPANQYEGSGCMVTGRRQWCTENNCIMAYNTRSSSILAMQTVQKQTDPGKVDRNLVGARRMRVPQVAFEAPGGAVLSDAAKSAGAAHGLCCRDLLAGLLKVGVRQEPAHSLLCAAGGVPPAVAGAAMAARIGHDTAAAQGQRSVASGWQLSSWLHPQISLWRANTSQSGSTYVSRWVCSCLTVGCVDHSVIEEAAVPVAPKQDAIIGSPVEGAIGDAAAAVQTAAPTADVQTAASTAEAREVVQRVRLPGVPCAAVFKPTSLQQRLRNIQVSGRRLIPCMPNGCGWADVSGLPFGGGMSGQDNWEIGISSADCSDLSWCTGRG